MRVRQHKQPDGKKLRAQRYNKWLKSLKRSRPSGKEPIVIQMIPIVGKTATLLSEREIEVLQLVSFGYNTEQIAKELFLSSYTIDNHRKNMLARSRCGNLAELVRVAIKEDLLH
ncbi:MAG: LuxR C-terminal-related transcriptional regulator [Flavobacteriales bacterium]|jgi:DNA-binding NarL/FixJ family response regulator|nr:LuxR C-terminal-related transcriptional regulator [Flavobacteriales bacterium]